MPRAQAIILTGPSSTGKSSAAREIVNLWTRPAVILDADAVLGTFPPGRYGEVPDGALNEGLFRAAAGFLEVGISVLVEQIFWKPAWAADAERVLAGHPHWLFLLTCAPAVATSREATRLDRRPGTHLEQRERRWSELPGATLIDTSGITPPDVARQILRHLERHGQTL